MMVVGVVEIVEPLLELAQAADLERRQAGARRPHLLAEVGVDAQDLRDRGDLIEERAHQLESPRSGPR